MLKQYMLKKNKEFAYVHRKGASCAGRYLVLVYVKNRMGLRLGFSVSKKLGNSVVRNRVKRRLREAFRSNLPLLLPGFDLIVIARDAARDAPFSSLADSLRYLLRKAGLFQKPKRP